MASPHSPPRTQPKGQGCCKKCLTHSVRTGRFRRQPFFVAGSRSLLILPQFPASIVWRLLCATTKTKEKMKPPFPPPFSSSSWRKTKSHPFWAFFRSSGSRFDFVLHADVQFWGWPALYGIWHLSPADEFELLAAICSPTE